MSNVTVHEALKAAIEYINLACVDDNFHEASCNVDEIYELKKTALEGCKAALAEIEKCEPVAWREWNENTASWDFNTNGNNEEPLFSVPKPRDWISLTYDQKMDLKENNDWYNFPSDLIEATEAKLKQLNTKG